MLLSVALKAINHLLAGEDWTRQRLQAFSGQSLRLELGRLGLPLQIAESGFFVERTPADSHTTESLPAVTITLPVDAPARLLLDRSSLVSSMQISGSAELAECLGFVFKNLRWDPEHDLAQVIGDIGARRVVEGGKRFAGWQTLQITNLTANLVEFFTSEQPALIRREDATNFSSAVAIAESAVARLEARISKLELLSGK